MGIINFKIKKHPANTGLLRPYLILEDFARLLVHMPPNTSVCGVTAVFLSTHVEFTIKLHNDIFVDGSTLESRTEYVRDIGFTENGTIVEFNRSSDFNLEAVVRREPGKT